MDEAVQSDRVVVMDKGSILIQGTPQQVFSEVDLLKQHSLDVPQSVELMYLLKKQGVNIKSLPLEPNECISMLKDMLK